MMVDTHTPAGWIKTPAVLMVKRDNTTSGNGLWRLCYAETVDAQTFCYTEGECSARYFSTRHAAIAYGVSRYGETAVPMRDYV